MSILLILAMIVLPSVQIALVKTKVTKCQTDMLLIKNAILMYHADHDYFPPTETLLQIPFLEIDDVAALYEPRPYLSHVPQSPWRGTNGILRINMNDVENTKQEPRRNYLIGTENDPTVVRNQFFMDWSVSSDGPVSFGALPSPKKWYNTTNGIISEGGFWMDSRGIDSFQLGG